MRGRGPGYRRLHSLDDRDPSKPNALEIAIGKLIQKHSQPPYDLVSVAVKRIGLRVKVLVLVLEHPLLESEQFLCLHRAVSLESGTGLWRYRAYSASEQLVCSDQRA